MADCVSSYERLHHLHNQPPWPSDRSVEGNQPPSLDVALGNEPMDINHWPTTMTEILIRNESPPKQSAMRVLAITSFRPEEISLTASEMTVPVDVITVEPSDGRVGHIKSLYEQTRRAIRNHDPDVILLDCYETMGFVVTVLAQRHDVPLVARMVGDTWRGYEQPTLGEISSGEELLRYGLHRASLSLDEFIFERVDGFVSVSNDLQTTVCCRIDCPPETIGVVPVPMTTDTLCEGDAVRGRRTLNLDEQQVVLTVTNLKFPEKFKGVKRILSEVEPVLRDNPNAAYVIAGGGRFGDRLESLIVREYGHLADRIYAPGYVENVSDLYAFADVFAYVSYRDGYPNAVLEAQTAKLPVVANEDYGMVDQITDGETGYLVDPETDGELGNHLGRLLNAPEERAQIGENARRRVLEENAPDEIAEQLQQVLQSIVDQC